MDPHSKIFEERLPGTEVQLENRIHEMPKMNLKQFDLVILSGTLPDGLWLKALPFAKVVGNIILIVFPTDPDITEKVATRYGVGKLYKVPLNSQDLLGSVKEMMAKKTAKSPRRGLSESIVNEMETIFKGMNSLNYYEFLKVRTDSTQEDVKRRYIEIAKVYHPDRFRKESEKTKQMAYEITKRANEAYSVLSHPSRKLAYDRMLSKDRDAKRFDFHLKMGYEATAFESVDHPQARRFVELAEKAIKERSYKPALNQLKMARRMAPKNKYIIHMIEKVENLIEKGE